MPIFESNGKKYNVQDEHIEKFRAKFPDATTIMERDGKKYRVKANDYNTFLGDTLQAAPSNMYQLSDAGKVVESMREKAGLQPKGDLRETDGYTFTASELGIGSQPEVEGVKATEMKEAAEPMVNVGRKVEPMPESEYLGKIALGTPNTPVEGDIYRGEYGTYTRTEVPFRTKEYASLEDARAGRELNIEVSDEEALARMRGDAEVRATEPYAKGLKMSEPQEDAVRTAMAHAKEDLMPQYPYIAAEEVTDTLFKEFESRRGRSRAAESNEAFAQEKMRAVSWFNPETGETEIKEDAFVRADDLDLIDVYTREAKKRILADKEMKARAQENADALGMKLEDYVDAVAVPTLQERMWNEWIVPQEEEARKNYNALGAMWDNSVIGMLDSHFGVFRPKSETKTDRYMNMVGQEEWSKNASLLERAGGFAGAMALDLPFFIGLGKLASAPAQYAGKQALKQMVARETQKVVARGASEAAAKRYANYVVKNGLKNRILLNLSTAPLQSGLTFGMFDAGKAALNMSLNDEWSWKELGKSAAGGTLLGGALGVTSAAGSALTHGLSGVAKVGAKVAEFGVENAVFTEGGRLIGKLHGQEPENGWLEDYVESGATLLMIKAPHVVKNVAAIKGNKEASEVFTFNKLEREQLAKYGKDLNAVLESMLPRNENVAVEGKGVSLDGINEGRLTEEYIRVMNDAEIPMTTKAKLMAVVEGKAMMPPRVTDAKVEGNRVLTYDPMGRLVEVKEYKNDAAANKEFEKLQPAMDINLISVLEDMYIRIKGYEADDVTVREWLAKNPDVKAEDIATIVAKDNAGEPLTKAEQKILDSLRKARRQGLNDISRLQSLDLTKYDILEKDLSTGLVKPANERTDAENKAVNAYREALTNEVQHIFKARKLVTEAEIREQRIRTAEDVERAAESVRRSQDSVKMLAGRMAESDARIDETANDGMVYTTTNNNGEKIIITGGKVVLDNEGFIDVNQSEGLVALMPDGTKKPVRVDELREKFEVSNAEELKAAKREEIRQEVAAENGWKVLEPGAEIEIAFDGEVYKLKVEGRDERGDIILSGEGASMALPESVVQDAMKQADIIEGGETAQTGLAMRSDAFSFTDEQGEHHIEVLSEDKDEGMAKVIFDGVEGAMTIRLLNNLRRSAGVAQPEVAPVVEGQKGENAVESSPTGEVAASEQNVPVDEKGKKMWEQSTPEYIAEYIRVRKPEDVEAQMSVVSGMIEGLEKQKSKMDAMDAMDIDDKIAFWKKVGELIGGAKDVVDPISQLNAKHSSALTAFNSMLENIRREGNEQKAAIRYEGLENMVAELGKQLPEGYKIGIVDGKYTIVEAQPAETVPVVESAPVVENSKVKGENGNVVETQQATNEMQEDDLENAEKGEKGQKAVEPLEETDSSTLSQTSDQVSEQEKQSTQSVGEQVQAAEAEVNTTPTDAQKEAGNYKKGHVKIGPFNISIEQPKGSVRSGVDKDGKKWEVEMQNTYGYFRGTEGVDGDHIDVFLSNDIDGWDGRQVFVVDQRNADGSFDEHKVMLGFNDINDAEAAYISNYEEGWQGLGAITGVSIEEFEKWLSSSHRKTKAFAEYKNVKTDEGQSTSAESGVEDIQEPRSVEETLENGGKNAVPEWLNKVPDDGRNFFVYVKFAGENKYQAIDLGKGETVDRLVRATMLQKEQLQALVHKLPSVLLEDAEFQIRDAKGNIYYNSGKVAAENEVAKQEDKEVAVATEDELDVYLAEMKAAQERQKAFAQKSPRPSSFVEAYTANDAELIKRLDKQFNDALQTLVPLDILAIEATIRGMKDRKSTIKAGSANERKETPAYKAFDHIEKDLAKRKKQLEKELTEDDKRRLDIIKRGNRGELKETAQPKQENKPVESEPIKDEAPVTSETTEQPETEEVANAGPVNRETLQLNMSEEDFNALLNSGDKAAVSEYLAELDGALRIDENSPFAGQVALREEYRKAVEQYGKENIPAEVMDDLNSRMQPYSDLSRAIFDRKYALQDKLREIEANEAQAKEQAEKEAKAEHKQTAFGGFLASKTDLGASAAEKALSKKYNFDGKEMTVAEFVEDAVGNGNVKLSAIEEPKYKGASRAAWNRMDARQQEADAKRVKESGTKTVYTVNDHDFGKTAYDYAKFLLDKKAEQEKAAAKQKVKDAIEPFAKEKAAEQAPIKIEDVGEKIGGAKKDRFAEGMARIKAELEETDETLTDKLAKLPVSQVFNFDLEKLREGGISNEAISFIKIVKDYLPAKPRKTYKIRSWVNNTLALYKLCLEAGTNWDRVNTLLNGPQFTSSSLKEQFDAYMAIGGFDSGMNIGNAALRQLDNKSGRYDESGKFVTLAGKWYVRDAGKHGGIYDTKEEAVNALKAFAGDKAGVTSSGKKKEVKFAVYQRRQDKSIFIAVKGKSDIVIQDGFKSSKEAFDYIEANNAELQERYRALLDKTNADFEDNRPREGRDYRDGKDIPAEEFRTTFGFRGVEFGNWMTQEDRRKALNECYDALMDLAAVCKVSPQALSLGGTLGMAFGARGGGRFSAHYEPGKLVINLTKTKGAGSLAHEWFHALDNYFAKMGSEGLDVYATAGEGLFPEGVSSIGKRYYDRKSGQMLTEEEYNERMNSHEVRREMADAWKSLMETLKKSDYYKRSLAYAGLHNSNYWSRPTELGARAFSTWVENELSKQGASNDYLANNPRFLVSEATNEQSRFMPYPFDADATWMEEAFGNLFEVMQEKTTEDGKAVLYSIAEDAMLQDKGTEAFERATKVTMDAVERLKENGLDIEVVSQEEAEAMAELAEAQNAEMQTSKEIEAKYPDWLEGTTTESGKHSTQVEGTRKTYKKVGDWIEENMGKDVAILDASSGMGYGTADLRERGFNIEDVEPYQSEDRKQNNPATYSSYADIEKQYDYIISNAVLNVIPDDWRTDVLHNMADKLKDGGKLFINTRKAGEERFIKDKIELDSPQEVLVKRNGRIASYQRFFTPQELKEWVESELGDGYTVEIANKANSGTNGLAAVVVTKNNESPANGKTSELGQPILKKKNAPLANVAAKVSKNAERASRLDAIISSIEKIGEMGPHEFLHEVVNAMLLSQDMSTKKSRYAKLGGGVTLRLANHYGNAETFKEHKDQTENYGLVIKLSNNPFKPDKDVDYLEYVYFPDKLTKERQIEIAKGLKAFMEMGRYDLLPKPDKVNPSGKFVGRTELSTTDGKVYGWAVDGKIRLTPDGINPNTPVHEYAHLWGADVEKNNPKLWNEVVEAMKLSPVWNEVANDANYSNIHGNDSRMASEVLARLSGRENYRRTMEDAEKEIAAERDILGKVQKKGILNRIKNALKNFWNWVQRNVFTSGKRKDESGQRSAEVMPWEEFANSVVGDFYKGKNPDVKESSLERMAAGEAKKESAGKSAVKNNANFVSTYKTKDGKDIEYTSERAEGYGIQGGGTRNSYDGTGNSILQRQTDTGVPGTNSGLNADKGEFCVVERVFTENGAFNFTSGEKIESADDVAYIFSALEDAAKEHSFVVYVKDGKPTVIELGMGSFNATMVDIPTASLAYSRINPDHVYFVHNHPSGNLVCSGEDVAMLRVFEDMSDIPVTGVIINLKTGKYGTFDTERHSVIGEKRVPENEERLTVHTLDKQIFAPDYDPMAQPLVRSSRDVAQFLNSQRMGDRPKVSFLILSRANRIIGNIHTPFTDITTDTEAVARYINERVIQFGGENAILYGDFAISMDESRGFRLLQGAMERFGKTKLLDVVHVEGNFTKSAIDLGLLYEPETEYNVAKENAERYNSLEQDIPVESVQTQLINSVDLSNGPVRGVDEPEWKFKARREKWRRWVESNTDVKTPMPEKPFLQEGESIEEYEARMKDFNKELNKWKKDILSNESEIEKMMDILYEGKIPEMSPTLEDEFTEQVFKRYMGDDGIKVDRKSMRGMIMDEIIERRRKIETNNFDDVVFIDKVRKATTPEQRKAIPFIIEGTYNGKLSPELASVVNRIKDWFENVYQALQAADAMHSSGKIKNYVTHIWDKARTPKAVYENYISTRSKYTNRRSIETYAEGIALGMVPKYDDICDIMLEYGHIANEAIANKDFTDFLHMLRVDGEPVLKDATIRDPMYVRTSAEALDGYKVHKYAKGIVETVLGNIRTENAAEWMQKLAHFYDLTASLMKKINLSLSFFHHGALIETAVGAMGPAKTISTVFKNLVWDCMRSGELPALSNPEAARNAVNHLVQLGATEDYMAKEVNRLTGQLKGMLQDFSDKHPNFATKSIVKPAELLDFLNTGFDKVLWDYLHDGLKIYTFDKYAKEIEEYCKKKGVDDTTKDMLLNEAGQFVNDTFGGQFWELIHWSPATVKWMRRLLLSPDWTVSTIRQALAPLGFGTLYKDYEKNWFKRTFSGIPEAVTQRRKMGTKFWIIAMLTFVPLMNALNAWRRKDDVDEELKKAEERRKTDPEYKSPYELKYPEGMKWYDYTMYGNTIGHQTHLFGWRYDDDKEGYIRWGKQFRELPELFLGKDGFSFPGPMIDKMVGKANPALSASLAFLGYAKDGWQSKWMKEKKGWEKELGRVMMMASAFMPYSIPTDEDKEFALTDLMMPSSKGFSNYKAIREFETAILAQDFDYVGAVYDACVMNKLDAEKLLQVAIARVEAQAKAEYVEGANTLEEAWAKYQEDLEVNEKRAVRAKFNKLLQENAYKDFEKQEARDMVKSVLDGTYREEKLPDAYVANETPDDVRDANKMDAIRLRLKKVVDGLPEDAEAYRQYYKDNRTKIDLYDEVVAARREINLIMEDIKIYPQQTEQFMQEIRDIRKEVIELANNLTSNNE